MLADIDAVLAASGSARSRVLRVECFLADAADFPAWNRIWSEHFAAPRPARTTVVADFAVPGILIELQVTAGVERQGWRAAKWSSFSAAASPACRAPTTCRRRRVRRHRGREQPHRQRCVVRERRLAVPGPAGPLPEPGLTLYGMRTFLDRDSALYFQPAYFPRLAPWLLRFWTYCNERDHAHGTSAIARLGHDIFELVEQMRADGVECELYKQGMVFAARSPDDARNELRKLQPMREHGYELPDDILTGAELHELEPALSEKVRAGFQIRGTGTCGPTRSRPAWPTCCAATASTSARAPRWSSSCSRATG